MFGFSRLLATYALTARNPSAAQRAVALTPKDAEAHFANGLVLASANTMREAVTDLERAVALRPADYTLWQQLGLLRDQAGDTAGAIAAFDEAIRRAPFYSQPRWNRGNVLLRKGEYEAAFKDLSEAAESNPELVPSLLDLAWGISKGDMSLTERLAPIKSDKMRLAFAKLLARHGRAQDAIVQIRSAGPVSDATRKELIDQLLLKGAYPEAFELWKGADGRNSEQGAGATSIYDGGFEGTLAFADNGFGWRVPRGLKGISLSLDSSQPHSGSKDLRVEFGGDSSPAWMVISQLIMVAPSQRYRISFASRSQDLVTGGLPIIVINDASGDLKRLGQSAPLGKGTSDWQRSSFEFATTPATNTVVLSLQRENCTTSPCPIFGSISLDSFSVQQIH